jgi:hypothetical protein
MPREELQSLHLIMSLLPKSFSKGLLQTLLSADEELLTDEFNFWCPHH